MNNNADFTDVHSILRYADDNIEKLHKIEFLCGYQSAIDDICERLRRCLRNKSYLNFEHLPDERHHHALRRIVFYLMLNTEHNFAGARDLTDDVAVVHILQSGPQLPPFLCLIVLWTLRLDQFLYEAITYTPHWFAIELVPEVLNSLKASTVPEINRAQRIGQLVAALFENIARCGDDGIAIDETRIVSLVAILLREFMFIGQEDLAAIAGRKRRAKFLGYIFKHLLSTAERCMAIMLNMSVGAVFEKANESIDSVFGSLDQQLQRNAYNSSTADARNKVLLRIIHGLLNAIHDAMKLINVDIFVDWADTDLDEQFTMQRFIGESAYRLNEQLVTGGAPYEHDCIPLLGSFSQRPRTIEDVVRDATMSELMQKLDSIDVDAVQRHLYIDEFIARGVLVLGNDECLDTLEDNAEYLSVDQLAAIIAAVHKLHAVLHDTADRLRRFIIKMASERLRNEAVQRLIVHSMQLQPDEHGVDLELESFSVSSIGLFNRCTAPLLRTSATMALMLQNPLRFVEHALVIALRTDAQQELICALLDELYAHGAGVQTPVLVQKAVGQLLRRGESLPDDERTRLGALLVRVHGTQFAGAEAFYQFFYRHVCEASGTGHAQTVLCMLHALQTVLHRGGSSTIAPAMAAPLLVMCAAIMDRYRWDIVTYAEERVSIVTVTVEIMHVLRNRFLPLASAEQRAFIVDKVAAFKPITRFYYQRFRLARNEQPVDFVTFIRPAGREEAIDADALTAMSAECRLECLLGMIVRCTRKECAMLASNVELRPYWFLAIALMARVVGRSSTEMAQSWACLRHAAQSLAYVVRVSVFKFSHV